MDTSEPAMASFETFSNALVERVSKSMIDSERAAAVPDFSLCDGAFGWVPKVAWLSANFFWTISLTSAHRASAAAVKSVVSDLVDCDISPI